MFISIVRESIAIANSDETNEAMVAVSLHFFIIGLMIIVYFIFALLRCLVYYINQDQHLIVLKLRYDILRVFSTVLQFFAGALYLYGDNIVFLLDNLGKLGCDDTCKANSKIAAFFLHSTWSARLSR